MVFQENDEVMLSSIQRFLISYFHIFRRVLIYLGVDFMFSVRLSFGLCFPSVRWKVENEGIHFDQFF